MISTSPIFLAPWSDAVGPLSELREQDGQLLAKVGPVIVALPVELRVKLGPFIGQDIGILRADSGFRIKIMRREHA